MIASCIEVGIDKVDDYGDGMSLVEKVGIQQASEFGYGSGKRPARTKNPSDVSQFICETPFLA